MYEPTHADFGWRQKLFYLLRLVPMVEKNYNLIEQCHKSPSVRFDDPPAPMPLGVECHAGIIGQSRIAPQSNRLFASQGPLLPPALLHRLDDGLRVEVVQVVVVAIAAPRPPWSRCPPDGIRK